MRPASAAPSISEGASNHAVATPSTTRQSVPISVIPGTVEPIPDDLFPDSDQVCPRALMDAVTNPAERVSRNGRVLVRLRMPKGTRSVPMSADPLSGCQTARRQAARTQQRRLRRRGAPQDARYSAIATVSVIWST
jgi:hypothetical protein